MFRALAARRRLRKGSRMWDAAAKGSRGINAILAEAGADRAMRHRVETALVKGRGMPADVADILRKGGKV